MEEKQQPSDRAHILESASMPKIRLSQTEDEQDSHQHCSSSLTEHTKPYSSSYEDYGRPSNKAAKLPSKQRPGDPDLCPLVAAPHRIHGSQVPRKENKNQEALVPQFFPSACKARQCYLYPSRLNKSCDPRRRKLREDLINKCIVSATASLIQLPCGLQQKKCCLNGLPVRCQGSCWMLGL